MHSRIAAIASSLVLFHVPGSFADARSDVQSAPGINRGIIVHVGCGDGTRTTQLLANDSCIVHGLDTDGERIAITRESIKRAGLYGRVSIAQFDGRHLPYIANLINLVVVSNAECLVPREEFERVLAPGGVLISHPGSHAQVAKWTKPWPGDIDEWPQYLHGADNNAVARDSVVGPPRHLQWTTDPVWSRSHMAIPSVVAIVSSKGRLFTIEDTATPENPFLPGRFALVARDAFNGIKLWHHDIAEWESITRYVKDIAMQLQDRMAAIGDTLYATPGLESPLVAFDAATGEVIKTYPGTERTQEIAFNDGILFLAIGDPMNAARYNIVKTHAGKGENLGGYDERAPFGGTGFWGAYSQERADKDETVCDIVAIDAGSGKELWRDPGIKGYTACTLAARGRRAVYQTRQGMVCRDAQTGEAKWKVDKPIQSGDGTEANPLVLSDAMVYAKEGALLHAYSLVNGTPQWTAPIADNYEKAADLFIAAGYVWTGGSKQPTAYDPVTGERIKTLSQRMNGPMGHDRCYRNFITERYYINSKTGGADFLDLATSSEFPNHWLRGTCGMGVLPCNGLLYVPPYSCQCSVGAMITGFNACYAGRDIRRSDEPVDVKRSVQLVKGPAYGSIRSNSRPDGVFPRDAEWPTYRCDGTRSGSSEDAGPAGLATNWAVNIGGRPSALTVAGGRLFVANVDAHTLHALDAADGSPLWTYTAGGRIDSPPTYHGGMLLFGSRDGWVHSVRASDGVLDYRFKDLPDMLIGAFGQLESAWPVCGSILVMNDLAYFAAGRSSFLDGGIFLYALNPLTGEVVHSRRVYGPFDAGTGFPATGNQGFKSDILVTDGTRLHLRHRAFTPELSDTSASSHVSASAGFLDPVPQHRTYWTLAPDFRGKTRVGGASGDILVTDGTAYYEVRGFPVQRHSYFDPRVKGYKLVAGHVNPRATAGRRADRPSGKRDEKPGATYKWSTDIPLTGRAMVLTADTVLVAGTPAFFPPGHAVQDYEAAYAGKRGGVLWVASAADGRKRFECKLDAPPCWDGMAYAYGNLYIPLQNDTVICLGQRN